MDILVQFYFLLACVFAIGVIFGFVVAVKVFGS